MLFYFSYGIIDCTIGLLQYKYLIGKEPKDFILKDTVISILGIFVHLISLIFYIF